MHLNFFNRQVDHLERQLNSGLPGLPAQLEMAPAYRQNPSALSTRDKPCREAAVLVLILPVENKAHLVLTVRRGDLQQHAGQVSFPGGKREADESLRQTALRETHEEIGFPPQHVRILGGLTPLYINVSNYCVHPFVGVSEQHNGQLIPQEQEVERILQIPLHDFIDPEVRKTAPRIIQGTTLEIPYFDLEDQFIWGATAMMLAELIAVYRPALIE